MLATVIALHLALAQAPAGAEPAPQAGQEGQEGAAPAALPATQPAAEPAGEATAPRAGEEEGALKTTRELPAPVTMRTRAVAKSALVPIPSIFSSEPLAGRSAVVGWAGWAAFGGAWMQGITEADDLGVSGEFDWSTAELRVSALYRRPLGRVGVFGIASRLRAGWYADLGARWFHEDNLKDRGIEFVPGIVLSARGAGGVFSLGGDLPIGVTLWRDGGIFAAPKASLTYETALYGDLTAGVRVAASYRAGAGDAPLADPRALLELEFILGRRLF
ncbi:MAG TPA: hypothetical protein VLT47_14690 [Anaeromyxobacteraceae bacterium]|nr:hypothetical protein [Anaeromyxobacteraceae bacterium]